MPGLPAANSLGLMETATFVRPPGITGGADFLPLTRSAKRRCTPNSAHHRQVAEALDAQENKLRAGETRGLAAALVRPTQCEQLSSVMVRVTGHQAAASANSPRTPFSNLAHAPTRATR